MKKNTLLIIGLLVGIPVGAAAGLYIFPRGAGATTSQELALQVESLEDEVTALRQQVESMAATSGDYDEFVAEVHWYTNNNNSIVTIVGDLVVDDWTSVAYSHYLPFDSWISLLGYTDQVANLELSKQELRTKAKDMREILDQITDDPALGEPRIFIDPLGGYLGFIYFEENWETTQLCWTHIE
jgi:prefoldin subunit 5